MCESIADGGRRCSKYESCKKAPKVAQVKIHTTTEDTNAEGTSFSSKEAVAIALTPTPQLSNEEAAKVLKKSSQRVEARREIQRNERKKSAGRHSGSYASVLNAAPAPITVRLNAEQQELLALEAEVNGHRSIGSLTLQKMRGEHPLAHDAAMSEKFMAERQVWFEMDQKQRELLVKTRNTAAQGIAVVDEQLAELEIRIIALQGAAKDSDEYKAAGEIMKERKALSVEKARLMEQRKHHENVMAEQQAKVRAFFQGSARALSFIASHRKRGGEFGQFFILGMAGVAQLAAARKARV